MFVLLAATTAPPPAAPSAPGTPPRMLNFSALFGKGSAGASTVTAAAALAPPAQHTVTGVAGNGDASQSNGSVLTTATTEPSDQSESVTPRDDENGPICEPKEADLAAALHGLSIDDAAAVQ